MDEDVDEEETEWDDFSETEILENPRHEPAEKPLAKPEPVMRSTLHYSITPLLKRATAQDLSAARKIVKESIAKSSKLNAARVAKPRRKTYTKGASNVAVASASSPPILNITDKIADAAALMAEAEAVGATGGT